MQQNTTEKNCNVIRIQNMFLVITIVMINHDAAVAILQL